MNKFNIPTPDEVDYENNELFEQIIQIVSNSLKQKIFSIKVQISWFPFEQKIKQLVKEYGWEMKNEWDGSYEEGYSSWKFIPNQRLDNYFQR